MVFFCCCSGVAACFTSSGMFRVSSQTRDNVEWKTQADFRCRKGAALFVRSLFADFCLFARVEHFQKLPTGKYRRNSFWHWSNIWLPFSLFVIFCVWLVSYFYPFFCGPDGQEKLKTKRAAALPLALLSSGGVGLAVSWFTSSMMDRLTRHRQRWNIPCPLCFVFFYQTRIQLTPQGRNEIC